VHVLVVNGAAIDWPVFRADPPESGLHLWFHESSCSVDTAIEVLVQAVRFRDV
jgi:hypothetical protein